MQLHIATEEAINNAEDICGCLEIVCFPAKLLR